MCGHHGPSTLVRTQYQGSTPWTPVAVLPRACGPLGRFAGQACSAQALWREG